MESNITKYNQVCDIFNTGYEKIYEHIRKLNSELNHEQMMELLPFFNQIEFILLKVESLRVNLNFPYRQLVRDAEKKDQYLMEIIFAIRTYLLRYKNLKMIIHTNHKLVDVEEMNPEIVLWMKTGEKIANEKIRNLITKGIDRNINKNNISPQLFHAYFYIPPVASSVSVASSAPVASSVSVASSAPVPSSVSVPLYPNPNRIYGRPISKQDINSTKPITSSARPIAGSVRPNIVSVTKSIPSGPRISTTTGISIPTPYVPSEQMWLPRMAESPIYPVDPTIVHEQFNRAMMMANPFNYTHMYGNPYGFFQNFQHQNIPLFQNEMVQNLPSNSITEVQSEANKTSYDGIRRRTQSFEPTITGKKVGVVVLQNDEDSESDSSPKTSEKGKRVTLSINRTAPPKRGRPFGSKNKKRTQDDSFEDRVRSYQRQKTGDKSHFLDFIDKLTSSDSSEN